MQSKAVGILMFHCALLWTAAIKRGHLIRCPPFLSPIRAQNLVTRTFRKKMQVTVEVPSRVMRKSLNGVILFLPGVDFGQTLRAVDGRHVAAVQRQRPRARSFSSSTFGLVRFTRAITSLMLATLAHPFFMLTSMVATSSRVAKLPGRVPSVMPAASASSILLHALAGLSA